MADNDEGAGPSGFAVRCHLGEHVHTDIVARSVDAFPVRTGEELVELLAALIATDPAGAHPNSIGQFLGTARSGEIYADPEADPDEFCQGIFFRGMRIQVRQR